MRGRFAVCFAAVVATVASTLRFEMINPDYADPGIGPMTGIATIACGHVCLWLRRRVAAARLTVTTGAMTCSAGEQSVRMARLAFSEPVRSFKPVSGSEMVECRLSN